MSKHKQMKEIVLSQALDYEKQIPKDKWIGETRINGRVNVSGLWIQDVIDVLTKKHKGSGT